MTAKENIHATGIVVDGIGVLIRGNSGAGKSLLALTLLEKATLSGQTGTLVGDDRLEIFVENDALHMSSIASIAGKIEMYGFGIVDREWLDTAPVHLIVNLEDQISRMPAQQSQQVSLLGVKIPTCPVANNNIIGLTHQTMIVMEAIKTQKSIRMRMA